MSSVPPTTDPMAGFLDLPPEIRQSIYDLLLVDPIRDNICRQWTVYASGVASWTRTIGDWRPREDQPRRIRFSISHTDYSDLLSLASTSKLLYVEATPTLYSHAQLEYTSGICPSAHANSRRLNTYLEKLSPPTLSLYNTLTISDRHLSVERMKKLVDLINIKLPNLLFLNLLAFGHPQTMFPHRPLSSLSKATLRIIAAARPISQLMSRPIISIDPRFHFYERSESFIDSLCTAGMGRTKLMKIMEVVPSLMSIRDWRCAAQDCHTMACERGDYLLLTCSLRSNSAETTNMEALDDIEGRLVDHHAILSRIEKYGITRRQLDDDLRKLRW